MRRLFVLLLLLALTYQVKAQDSLGRSSIPTKGLWALTVYANSARPFATSTPEAPSKANFSMAWAVGVERFVPSLNTSFRLLYGAKELALGGYSSESAEYEFVDLGAKYYPLHYGRLHAYVGLSASINTTHSHMGSEPRQHRSADATDTYWEQQNRFRGALFSVVPSVGLDFYLTNWLALTAEYNIGLPLGADYKSAKVYPYEHKTYTTSSKGFYQQIGIGLKLSSPWGLTDEGVVQAIGWLGVKTVTTISQSYLNSQLDKLLDYRDAPKDKKPNMLKR